ncbi:hypothetical protein ACQ4PT_070923 [Festuca glaucescens]
MGARPSKASAPAATPSPPPEASSCSSLWSELLRRLLSLADRVRFGSVCRHWRDAARQQASLLPPVLPWTITFNTGIVQTIPDGEVHRLCSDKPAFCSCSSDSWLLMIGATTTHRHFLENPVSGVTLPLPSLGNLLHPGGELYLVAKVMVCPDNLVVVMTRSRIPSYNNGLVACCRPGKSSWSSRSQAGGNQSCYEDIAFHDRSIYAITEGGELFAHKVTEHHGRAVLSSGKLVIKGVDTDCFDVRRFLVVSCGGRLLMVKWNHSYGLYDGDDVTSAFELFEAGACFLEIRSDLVSS